MKVVNVKVKAGSIYLPKDELKTNEKLYITFLEFFPSSFSKRMRLGEGEEKSFFNDSDRYAKLWTETQLKKFFKNAKNFSLQKDQLFRYIGARTVEIKSTNNQYAAKIPEAYRSYYCAGNFVLLIDGNYCEIVDEIVWEKIVSHLQERNSSKNSKNSLDKGKTS